VLPRKDNASTQPVRLRSGQAHWRLQDYVFAATELPGTHCRPAAHLNNYVLIGDLALVNMGLGDKAAALALAEQAMTVLPLEKDVVDGPAPIEILARVSAQLGEPDRAIAALQKLLSIPSEGALASRVPLTPALLRLDPMFDPLRNDQRFRELTAEPISKSSSK
jgi:hypothetical protein